ncbi:membrane protein [Nocardioides baekrokdamisoli]|uniref:Membrane protein n=1 Tax=Nocardioides baekrokdamisoli TaxID=1804624 RepID=A0A3G9IUQ3_9ACTN|nr:DUF3566 domain-containing protein [Nocardioides baekrokdamisoli]BBH17381.1 membrane protein [Nocardioides baekrokdamisoli]
MNDDATRVHESVDDTQTRMGRIAAAVRSVTPETHQGFAKVKVVRVDPWSVGRIAFVISIGIGIAMMIATVVLWWVLGAIGVWDDINRSVQTILNNGSTFSVTDYLSTFRVIGFMLVVSLVEVVVVTTGATLGAYLYNLAAETVGGINLTLAGEVPGPEDD